MSPKGPIVIDEGHPNFDEMLSRLVPVKTSNWAVLYQDANGTLWDVTFPQGELQGGGPRRLRRLPDTNPDVWDPYGRTTAS
ncbi:hypothetical protein JJE66_06470 [Bradyrhizobium diazoefficiens]|nr:hypothetical protein [Bradyrhizobium diazoefficiens]